MFKRWKSQIRELPSKFRLGHKNDPISSRQSRNEARDFTETIMFWRKHRKPRPNAPWPPRFIPETFVEELDAHEYRYLTVVDGPLVHGQPFLNEQRWTRNIWSSTTSWRPSFFFKDRHNHAGRSPSPILNEPLIPPSGDHQPKRRSYPRPTAIKNAWGRVSGLIADLPSPPFEQIQRDTASTHNLEFDFKCKGKSVRRPQGAVVDTGQLESEAGTLSEQDSATLRKRGIHTITTMKRFDELETLNASLYATLLGPCETNEDNRTRKSREFIPTSVH